MTLSVLSEALEIGLGPFRGKKNAAMPMQNVAKPAFSDVRFLLARKVGGQNHKSYGKVERVRPESGKVERVRPESGFYGYDC